MGLQRSGTTVLARRLGTLPSVELHNETSRRAFHRFQLLPDPALRALVEASGHKAVLFKALCDSHRAVELLDGLGTPSPGRAIWVYRDYENRARSAIAKFGPDDLEVLREIAAGRAQHRWQARGLSAQCLEFIRSFDWDRMNPASACCVFWYVRNMLFFEQQLDRRQDVFPLSYDGLLAQPPTVMRALCEYLELAYSEPLVEGLRQRGSGSPPLDIDPEVRERCDELGRRLDDAARRRLLVERSA
jgi:hypothetical protein